MLWIVYWCIQSYKCLLMKIQYFAWIDFKIIYNFKWVCLIEDESKLNAAKYIKYEQSEPERKQENYVIWTGNKMKSDNADTKTIWMRIPRNSIQFIWKEGTCLSGADLLVRVCYHISPEIFRIQHPFLRRWLKEHLWVLNTLSISYILKLWK